MRQRLLVGLVASVALTACGSTVQMNGQGLGNGATGLGTTTQTGPAGSVGGPAGSTSVATPGATSTSAGGTSTTTGNGGQTGSAGTSTGGGGVTTPSSAKPVEVGIVTFGDVNQAAAMFGGSANVGSQQAEALTAVNWVNAHGGLAGHKISPVFYDVALTSTETYASTYQKICANFTQDHHVVAAVFIGNAETSFADCLAKTKTLLYTDGHYLHSADDYAKMLYTVTPDDAGSDRVARAIVSEILGHGYLKSGDTLGLLVMDYAGPVSARDKIIVPMLKARGIKVIDYTIPPPQSTPDIANSASVVSSAELKMAAQGVKNVTFLCPGCAGFFMQDAESQNYYPRYIVTSYDTMLGVKGKGHGKSLASALGIGWDPQRDVGSWANPGLMSFNSSYKICRTIEKANYNSDDSMWASLALCGAFYDLYTAAQANPVQPVAGASLLGGFNSFGTSHPAVFNFTTELTATRHDGAASYRTLHYDKPCDCMQYDNSSNKPLS